MAFACLCERRLLLLGIKTPLGGCGWARSGLLFSGVDGVFMMGSFHVCIDLMILTGCLYTWTIARQKQGHKVCSDGCA